MDDGSAKYIDLSDNYVFDFRCTYISNLNLTLPKPLQRLLFWHRTCTDNVQIQTDQFSFAAKRFRDHVEQQDVPRYLDL